MDDVFAPHPDEVLLTAGRHGDRLQRARMARRYPQSHAKPRRGLTLSFCRRDERQQLNQAEYIGRRCTSGSPPAERYLLDA